MDDCEHEEVPLVLFASANPVFYGLCHFHFLDAPNAEIQSRKMADAVRLFDPITYQSHHSAYDMQQEKLGVRTRVLLALSRSMVRTR